MAVDDQADISVESVTVETRVGDLVYHDGERNFFIIKISKAWRRESGEYMGKLVQFENVGARVTCHEADLVYSERRKAWYLPGRVFPIETRKDQRDSGYDPLEIEKSFMSAEEQGDD